MILAKKSSIRNRMLSLVILTSLVTIIFGILPFIYLGIQETKQEIERNLNTVTNLIGEENASSVAFFNPQYSKELLQKIRIYPNILSVCIYDTNYVFSTYPQEGANCPNLKTLEEQIKTDQIIFRDKDIILKKNIVSAHEIVGSIFITSSNEDLNAYIKQHIIAAIIMIFFVSLITALIITRMYFQIVGPINTILTSSALIAESDNFDHIVENYHYEELERLQSLFIKLACRAREAIDHKEKMLTLKTAQQKAISSALDETVNSISNYRKYFKDSYLSLQTVSQMLEEKLLGTDVQSYFPFIQDLDIAIEEYEFKSAHFYTLIKLYCDAVKQPPELVPIFHNLGLLILKINELPGVKEFKFDLKAFAENQDVSYLYYFPLWFKQMEILEKLISIIVFSFSSCEKIIMNYHSNANETIINFFFNPFIDIKDTQSRISLDKFISSKDIIFLIDCLKYLGRANKNKTILKTSDSGFDLVIVLDNTLREKIDKDISLINGGNLI